MQHPQAGNDPEIVAWVTSNEPEYPDLPRDELTINLSMSQETADLVRLLLKKWMHTETTPHEMTSFIHKTLPPIAE